ncbi:hypothetical protein DRW03_25100 [Corallococcus sp. H22C18031201]|uniref:hypothetical protein n=1 Tax=Citreicoccus inhibens TaxID=2849499 RepID=UPI000E76C64D|nr:hypothetical protein [Citreicoccus inhibens]MBU8899668.1 hypothetical protein [Citreicoccus inhibens]RJS18405.1 hypothetical protein DRW03_25100 [Corallococcus sp. H22C18031201]
MPVDTNRRVSSSRPVGRVLGGQDRFEKEGVEGPPEGGLAATRRERLSGGPPSSAGEESPFAAKLRRLADGAAKKPDGGR